MTKWCDSRPSEARTVAASRVSPRCSSRWASNQDACAATSGCAPLPSPPRTAASSARASTFSSNVASAASAPAPSGCEACAASRAASDASSSSYGAAGPACAAPPPITASAQIASVRISIGAGDYSGNSGGYAAVPLLLIEVIRDRVAQRDAGAVQARLHGRHRDPEDLARLFGRQPLDVAEQED